MTPHPELIEWLEGAGFKQHPEKPNLYQKDVVIRSEDPNVALAKTVKAYVDFRQNDKGSRYCSDKTIDKDSIEVLKAYKDARDAFLTGKLIEKPTTTVATKSDWKAPLEEVAEGKSIKEGRQKGEVNKMESKPEEKGLIPQEKAVVPITTESGFLTPVTTIEDALSAFELFERAKTKLLKDTDVLWIGANGRPAPKCTGRPHIKRSGWRKLARFFGINCSIIDKEKIISEDVEGKFYLWKYRVRAQHIKGGFFEADGVGSSRDPFFSKKGGMRVEPDENDIMMKAQTVAFNRAISDLLGSGEVSADEIQSEDTK